MPSWKKVILSGSDASLSSLTTTGNVSGSATSTGSFGNISIIDFPNLSASLARADSLGDHVASQDLNLANNAIESASRILATVISGSSITGSIGSFADLLADFVTSSIGDFNALTASLANLGVIDSSQITTSNLTVTTLTGGSPLEITASNFTVTKSGSLTLSGSSTASFDRIVGSGIFSLGEFSDVSSSLALALNQSGSITSLSESLQSRVKSNKDDIDALQGSGNSQGVGESDSPKFEGITIAGSITGSIISASFITASNISSLVEGIDISDLSQSLANRITLEEGEAEGSVISSSAQIASDISGAFYSVSNSLSDRISNEESNVDNLQADSASFSTRITNFTDGTVTLVSGSAISTGSFGNLMHGGKNFDDAVSESVALFGFGQGAEVTALSQSLQLRVFNAESELGNTLISSSAQLANAISGSLSANAISALGANIISSSGDTVDLNGKKILFANVYSTEGDLPSATDNHGMFAHVHGTGLAYFAHAGNWIKLALSSSLSSLDVRVKTAESELNNTLISSSAQIASDVSGAFSSVSGGLEQRLTSVEAGSTSKTLVSSSAQIAEAISGSLGPNSTLIRSLNATGISGSFVSVSESIAADIAALEAGNVDSVTGGVGLSHNSTTGDVTLNIDFSDSTFATGISGSFTDLSQSLKNNINTIQGDITTLQNAQTAVVHTQGVSSATWPVTHSLGTKYPAVTVWDDEDRVIMPANIVADTTNTLTINFFEALTGNAAITFGAGGAGENAFTTTVSSSIVSKISSNTTSINSLNNKTLISSSAQLPSGIVSSSSQLPSGIVSSSTQISASGFITSASAVELGFGSGGGSSFTAAGISGSLSATAIVNLGAGIISSSAQISASAAASGFGSGGGGGGGSSIFTAGSGIEQKTTADIIVTGSIQIEASGSQTGSTLFDVVGNSGTLFQLNDISTGSLFAVNKASGVPILESFSDGKTEIGPFNNKVIIDGNISGSSTSTASFGALLVNGSTIGGVTNADIAGLGVGIVSSSAQLASDISGSISATSITAVGALMDSEVTSLSLIKTLTAAKISGSLSATAIAGLALGIVSSSAQISASAAASGFGAGGGGGGIFITGSGLSGGDLGKRNTLAELAVTGSVTIIPSGSETGSTVFDVIGNSGTLFQLNDISTGSLFAVNKASGVPIVESFSDGKTEIGPFNKKVIIDGNVSGSSISTGSFGRIEVDGKRINTLGISGSFQGELSGSNQTFVGGGVSGSAISTASFGYIEIGGTKITTQGGTVTEVEGTGTVSGISLTGTVTTNGQLTLQGSLEFDAANKAGISGSFHDASHSLQQRVTDLSTGAVTAASIRAAQAGIFSSSAQLPSGIVSSSSQLPSGIVSSSTQIAGLGFLTSASAAAAGFGSGGGGGGSFTATGISGSLGPNAALIRSLNATGISGSLSATAITALGAGIVSSSGQITDVVTQTYVSQSAAAAGFGSGGGGGGGSSIFTAGSGIQQKTLADIIVTGSIEIKASGSVDGTTLLNTNGNAGSILQLTDDLSTTLFSVAKPSGLPVMEVSASGRIAIGPFANPVIIDTSGNISGSGTSTGSFGKLLVDGSTIGATSAADIAALGAGILSGSIVTSSITNFPTEVSRSAAAAGFGAGGGSVTAGAIAALGAGIVSSSAQISASAAASGFGSGGGGGGGGGGGTGIFAATGSKFATTQDVEVTGSLVAKSTGSNTTIFSVDGVSEEMLTITDSLSGSLFSVVRTSGIPVMEVFSDGKVQLANLPTSDPGEPGMLYNDSGTLKISL